MELCSKEILLAMINIFLCASQVNRWVTSVDHNLQILSNALINLFPLCVLPEKIIFVLNIYRKKKMGLKTYAQKMCIQCAHLWCREVPKHGEVQCLRPRQRRITNVRSVLLIMIELGSLDHRRTACTLSWPSLQNSVSMICPCLTISKPSLWFVKGHYVNSIYSYSFLLTPTFSRNDSKQHDSKISQFVFRRWMKVLQVWNDMRVST